MMSSEHTATAMHDAVQEYLDALLAPDDVQASPEAPDSAPDGALAYRICRVSSVQLALPAAALDDPLPLPPLLAYSAADWLLGRHLHESRQLNVLDLARVIAPDVPRGQADMLIPVRSREWAIACTLQPAIAWLQHEQIQWREPGGMRPWLAGMSRDGRCAVVDVGAMLDMLDADPRFHPASGHTPP